MNARITRFRVRGLHGRKTVDVPIRDNRLVLLGSNGQGKTTLINLLYFVLSQQWAKLLDYQFDELTVGLGDEELTLKREDLQVSLPLSARFMRAILKVLPPSARHQLDQTPEVLDILMRERNSPRARAVMASQLRIPERHVDRLLDQAMQIAHDPQGRLFEEASHVRVQEELLRKHFNATVLYLPTYRRIERDLKALFPGLEDELRRIRGGPSRRSHVELVEFGMGDVEEKIGQALTQVREAARSQLNSLAGGYLRDVVRGQADAFDAEAIRRLSEADIERILERVEEQTLDDDDKRRLRAVIGRIKNQTELIDTDPFVAHYFAKLYEIHLELSKREESIQKFASVCSSYLSGKSIAFDDASYRIQIVDDANKPLELKHLSSGEKQIVSLFAHIYLGPTGTFAVLIDEPELSLSVEWQKTLLPDIWDSGRCAAVIAATHSPFIFENSFDPYASDLAQLTNVDQH